MNVLKQYLEEREKEVIDIMLTLFDQETATRNFMASIAKEADREARADERLINIRSLMGNMNLSAQDAMTALNIPKDQQAIYASRL